MKKFDTDSWNRKTQYEFFKNYEDPFFNLTTQLNVTNLYQYCKKNELSFFLGCLYLAGESANEMLEFRLRIIDNTVVEFDSIDIGSTVLHDDNTFSFCYFNRKNSIFDFDKKGKRTLQKQKENRRFDSNKNLENVIYCSFIPWTSFTSFKHAQNIERGSSGIPKFVFGKYFEENAVKKMPFSIEVHHALMDGYHVGKFLEIFQDKIDGLR
ncbi:MAG: chloramphenicol acetyltransferase [Flavobacteriaceae bacterium]|nr:MAG: chloramphenicol acetyltransferase [Flavobacteriaceae bacterium]